MSSARRITIFTLVMRPVHSSFPRGFPAAGLLVLRIMVGALAESHGFRLVCGPAELPFQRLIGAGAMVLGGAVLLGLVTSISGGLLGLGAIVLATAQGAPRNGEGTVLTLGFISICIAVALTGPGALSLDALLFGPREIVLRSAARYGNKQ